MAADVEQEVLVVGRAADAADVIRIGFDDGGRHALLGQQIGGRQSSRPRANNKDFRVAQSGPLSQLFRLHSPCGTQTDPISGLKKRCGDNWNCYCGNCVTHTFPRCPRVRTKERNLTCILTNTPCLEPRPVSFCRTLPGS